MTKDCSFPSPSNAENGRETGQKKKYFLGARLVRASALDHLRGAEWKSAQRRLADRGYSPAVKDIFRASKKTDFPLVSSGVAGAGFEPVPKKREFLEECSATRERRGLCVHLTGR
jgi:hypothetical protein